MSRLLRDNSAFLHLLMSSDTPKSQIKAILQTVSKVQLNCLTEIAYNLLKGNISISPSHKKVLKRHAKHLRALGKPKGTLKSKKAALIPSLITALLRIVAPVLKSTNSNGTV